MASTQGPKPALDRYVVIHVATTCDEHGVYVTKDSAEVIELGWILLDAKSCEEASNDPEEVTSWLIYVLTFYPSATPREYTRKANQYPNYSTLQ